MLNIYILFMKIFQVTEDIYIYIYKYSYNLPMNQTALTRKISADEC
jgi:hypothetical protein